MTNPNLTLIAALLDRSGSMSGCKHATETGFDEMMAKHREQPGDTIVTLAMFDDEYEDVYRGVAVDEVPALELVPRHMTAMLDAVGRFVTEIGEHLAGLNEADRPGTVTCLIMTDGLENASFEWSWDDVKALITQQREQYGWSFVFLGANIDAVEVGGRIGIPRAAALTYAADDDDAVYTSYARVARELVRKSSADLAGEAYSVSFTEDDRKEASGAKKKKR